MSGKNWLLHIPRFPDNLPWAILEIAKILDEKNQPYEILEFNHQLYKNFFNTPDWQSIDELGVMEKSKFPLFKVARLFYKCIKNVKNTDRILISLFSTESRSWALFACALIRKQKKCKIILGGNGIYAPGETKLESEWADMVIDMNLADHIFYNQADETLIDALDKNFNIPTKIYKPTTKFPNIGFIPDHIARENLDLKRIDDPIYFREDLDHTAMAGELAGIEWAHKIHFTMGCVKQCTFCDVHGQQSWVMRPAQTVVDEIKHYYEQGVRYFFLADSTVNGSNREWLKFLTLFADFQSTLDDPIHWNANYAIKPKNRNPQEQFELMRKSNFTISIGMDHCSDQVLAHMGKKYTWDDIEWTVDQLESENVYIRDALWIVGYPTETQDDLLEYNKLFELLKNKRHTFVSNTCNVCYIPRNSSLLDIIDMDWNNPNKWVSQNGKLTKEIRLERKKWVDEHLNALGPMKYKYTDSYRRAIR